MTSIRYNKKYKRKVKSIKVPQTLINNSDDTVEFSCIKAVSETNNEIINQNNNSAEISDIDNSFPDFDSDLYMDSDLSMGSDLLTDSSPGMDTDLLSSTNYNIDTNKIIDSDLSDIPTVQSIKDLGTKKRVSIKGSFSIQMIFELPYTKSILIKKLKSMSSYKLSDIITLNLIEVKMSSMQEPIDGNLQQTKSSNHKTKNDLILFTTKHLILISGEWKTLPFGLNQIYEIFTCNLCEMHPNIKSYKHITFISPEFSLIEVTDTSPYFLVYKSNYMNVTDLVKLVDCLYLPKNNKLVMSWPHIDSNNFKALNFSVLIGNCSHKIVQSKEPIDLVLLSSINSLLNHLVLNQCTETNFLPTLLELKIKLHEFYAIKFSEKPEDVEKKLVCSKLNLVFAIDMIFQKDIIELKSGARNFKDSLQVLYYFMCINYDEKRRYPKLIYLKDYLLTESKKKLNTTIETETLPTIKYSHSLFQSMIIKRNLVGLIDKGYLNEPCFCNNYLCQKINALKNEKISLTSLFINYLWKCIDLEEKEETKPIDVSQYFISHISIKEYLKIFTDTNDVTGAITILIFKDFEDSRFQIVNLLINEVRICKAYYIRKKGGLCFYKVNILLSMLPKLESLNEQIKFGSSSFLDKSNFDIIISDSIKKKLCIINIKMEKHTDTFRIQRFGLLSPNNIFDEKRICNYIKADLINNKLIWNIKNFPERDKLIEFYNNFAKQSEIQTQSIKGIVNFEDNFSSSYDWSEVNDLDLLKSGVITELYIPQKFSGEYKILNESQQVALRKCLSIISVDATVEQIEDTEKIKNTGKKEYIPNMIGIHGMPGTGKTRLLTLLIKILNYHQKRILVLTFTNRSLENIRQKLPQEILTYQTGKTLKSLKKHISAEVLITEFLKYRKKETVIFTNINNLGDPIFADIQLNPFDYLIVDEAGQLPLLYFQCLPPISNCILVGDHLQLKPVSVYNTSISILQWIKSELKVVLDIQYRMSLQIMKLSNLLFYDGALKHYKHLSQDKTIHNNFDIKSKEMTRKNQDIQLINGKIDSDELFNNLQSLIKSTKNVKVLCFFNRTKEELNAKFYKKHITKKQPKSAIENINTLRAPVEPEYFEIVETIDRFQGSEEETIIFLLDCKEVNEVNSCRLRVNVAITRAKSQLIIYGDLEAFNKTYVDLVCLKDYKCGKKCVNCVRKCDFGDKFQIPKVIVDLLCAVKYLENK
ncbi:DNA replication ATP-dependent helicase/nuclease DNA2 [Cucumispora dikerogammari]|nr:DNA replication ATP-dependent helicase/nuclease DNA2 [Cucumispora dikerogammari]